MNSPNNWTPIQYSIFRLGLGLYLLAHFAALIPWGSEVFSNQGMIATAINSPYFGYIPSPFQWSDSPWMVMTVLAVGAACGILITLGRFDRTASVLAVLILGWLFQRNPLIANPSLPVVGWMLLAHFAVRNFGGRSGHDVGSWKLDNGIWIAAWCVLAVAYSYSGYTKLLSPSWVSGEAIALVLENPLARDHWLRHLLLSLPPIFLKSLTWAVLYIELLFIPLCLFPRTRLWAWIAMLIVQFGFLTFLNFADLTAPMLLIHLLTFDPNWLRTAAAQSPLTLYYDGQCALCHRVVNTSLAEDSHNLLRYTPLQGRTAHEQLPPRFTQRPYSSFVIQKADGTVLTEGAALVELLQAWGGLWTIASRLLAALPAKVVNWGYQQIGTRRFRWFGQAPSICPLVPVQLRSKFLG